MISSLLPVLFHALPNFEILAIPVHYNFFPRKGVQWACTVKVNLAPNIKLNKPKQHSLGDKVEPRSE